MLPICRLTISGASINMGDIVLIWPLSERAQATISGPNCVASTCGFQEPAYRGFGQLHNLFTTTNATYDPTLHVEDCTVMPPNVVYDLHNTQNFKSVYFWNSIVKMTVANKPSLSWTKSKGAHTQQSIRLENNVSMPKRLCRTT